MTTCSGCDETWTAPGAAHCGATGCHRTFAGVALFDAHRSAAGEHGACLDPETLIGRGGARKGERLMFFREAMWRGPEMTEAQKVARFGAA